MPTEPVAPWHKAGESSLKWIIMEARDHFWPWSAEGWHSQRALQIAGFSLAVAAHAVTNLLLGVYVVFSGDWWMM